MQPLIAALGGAAISLLAWWIARDVLDAIKGSGPGGQVGVALVAGIVLSLLAHELGHLAGGALVGWKPVYLNVGPFRFARIDGTVRLRLHTQLPLYGGVALAVPDRWPGARAFRRENAALMAGGPLASALVAVCCLIAWPRAMPGGLLAASIASTAVMSSILAAATLIPMSAGGSFRSDGAQLLEMLRSHSRGADDSALALRGLRIMSAAHPPAAWDPALVSLALGPQATPFDAVSARLFASWASLARSDVATASRWLDEAWGMVPELGTTPAAVAARSEIAIEMAVQCVAWKQDPAEGRAW